LQRWGQSRSEHETVLVVWGEVTIEHGERTTVHDVDAVQGFSSPVARGGSRHCAAGLGWGYVVVEAPGHLNAELVFVRTDRAELGAGVLNSAHDFFAGELPGSSVQV
jgi:hypothetical protein